MPPTPKKPSDTTHRKVYRVVAYVAADGNSAVTDDDESTEWQVLDVVKEAGGLLQATLARDLGAIGKHVEDRRITERQNLQVEVWLLDQKGERLQPLFAGDMLLNTLRLAPGAESEQVTCRLAPFHYGSILEGQQVWDPRTEELLTTHLDVEFNPEIDGVLLNNRRIADEDTTGVPYSLWIDPESVRTDTAVAKGQQLDPDADVKEWTVADAAETLQWWLNSGESFVKNYRRRDQSFAPKLVWGSSPPRLESIALKRGQYLPQLLERLLPPHGFHFYISVHADERTGSRRAQPWIRIFKRGEGEQKKLKLQKRRERLDRTKTETESIDIVTDLMQLANVVTCHGGWQEKEVTIEMYRGWPEEDDATTDGDVTTRAWRWWVGNEAGDHCGLRTVVQPIPDTPLDLSSVFDEYVYKRRFFEDCLAYRESGTVRRPVFVEWSDDGGDTWQPVPEEWGYRVLTHELGIMFTGETPPEDLVAAGDDARIRVTGTIRGDKRLRKRASLQPASPVNMDVELFLDVSDRFFDRQQHNIVPFNSVLILEEADERDDADALQTFATETQKRVQSAVVRVAVALEGIQLGYQVSDMLTELDGRKISFDRNAKSSGSSRYVQVIGIRWDVLQQRTFLTVEPFER